VLLVSGLARLSGTTLGDTHGSAATNSDDDDHGDDDHDDDNDDHDHSRRPSAAVLGGVSMSSSGQLGNCLHR
jgi:hypothetical protein